MQMCVNQAQVRIELGTCTSTRFEFLPSSISAANEIRFSDLGCDSGRVVQNLQRIYWKPELPFIPVEFDVHRPISRRRPEHLNSRDGRRGHPVDNPHLVRRSNAGGGRCRSNANVVAKAGDFHAPHIVPRSLRSALYRRNMLQREYPVAPLVGVGAVIVHESRVLLVQRGREPMLGRWTIPGGLIEIGEALNEAVVRETREETGLEVEPIELVELLDRIHREEGRVRYHYIIADYLCRVVGGKLVAADDAAAVRWVERTEWNSHSALVLDPITVRVIEAAWQRAAQLERKGK